MENITVTWTIDFSMSEFAENENEFNEKIARKAAKEALKLIEGAEFMDALVTNVNGVQRLIIR